MNWIEKYKGGFSVGKGYETVEILLDKDSSTKEKLYFQAYDANLSALPNVSTWKKAWADKHIKFLEGQVSSNFTGEVWLDDVLIRAKTDKPLPVYYTTCQSCGIKVPFKDAKEKGHVTFCKSCMEVK